MFINVCGVKVTSRNNAEHQEEEDRKNFVTSDEIVSVCSRIFHHRAR